MRFWKVLPLLFLVTACSKAVPSVTPAKDSSPSISDPGFVLVWQDYSAARDALKTKRCDEKSCIVPRYPANQEFVNNLKVAAEKARLVMDYPTEAELGVNSKEQARAWRAGILAHAAKIETAIKQTQERLARLEPQLVPLRESLRLSLAKAAAEGCQFPAEGKVIDCTGVAPPLDTIEEARGLLHEMEVAATVSQNYQAISAAYAAVPEAEVPELLLARQKKLELDRYSALIKPTFGTQVREMVRARWVKVANAFKRSGLSAQTPSGLDQAFKGEPSAEMIAQAQSSLEAAGAFAGFAQSPEQFTSRAIDRIEVVNEASSVYGPEAFQYHPAHPNSLTVKLNIATGYLGLNWLLMGVVAKTDPQYLARQELISAWDKARAHPPKQEDAGTLVPVSIQVSDAFLDGLVAKLPLAKAIATMNMLGSARAKITAKLDLALRGGRSLRGSERIVICDFSSCGQTRRGLYMIELGDRNLELNEAELDDVVKRLAKGL